MSFSPADTIQSDLLFLKWDIKIMNKAIEKCSTKLQTTDQPNKKEKININ